MKKIQKTKANETLNLFQHPVIKRPCERLCNFENSSERRNKFGLFLMFSAIFLMFMFVRCESIAFAAPNPTVQTLAQAAPNKQNAKIPATIPEKNAYNLTHMKKDSFQYNFMKFLTTLAGVLISAAAIFFGLKFYKAFILKNNSNADNIDYDKTLESPKDFKEAINLFLDKTDKE